MTPVTLAPAEPSIDVQLRRLAPSVALDLVAARGQAALPVALSAFEGLRHAHSHDALTRRVFTADLAPLLALDLAGADDATRQAASELWLRRAQAWAQDGQLALAAYDLRRAAEELDRAGVDAGELRFEVELGLAASEATRDPEAARRHLDAARAAHPLPDLAEDLIRARSDLGAILETWL